MSLQTYIEQRQQSKDLLTRGFLALFRRISHATTR